jgi:hypothetical protein
MLLEGAGFVNHAFYCEPDLSYVCGSESLGGVSADKIKGAFINNNRVPGILQYKNIDKKYHKIIGKK